MHLGESQRTHPSSFIGADVVTDSAELRILFPRMMMRIIETPLHAWQVRPGLVDIWETIDPVKLSPFCEAKAIFEEKL
jgi:hypothetical protein